MRWSQIISIIAALLGVLAFSTHGLVIPSGLEDSLESRGRTSAPNPLNQGSKKDPQAAVSHGHRYDVQKGMGKWHAGECI